MSLTEKQRRFIEAYLLDPNGKQAALAAGYSASGAEVAASRLLRHAGVAAELAKRQKVLAVRSGITPEMVVAELAKLGFSDIRQVVEWRAVDRQAFDVQGEPLDVASTSVSIVDSRSMSADAAAAISEVSQSKDGTLKIKMYDKLGALVRIGQHLGMFRAAAAADEPGKKEEAQEGARNAQAGSDWENLLPGANSLQ